MEYFDNKKQLLIASEQFIFRLGIKTLLSVVGIESDMQETHNVEGLKSIMSKGKHLDYLIISDNLVPCPQQQFILELKRQCPLCKFMLISDHVIHDCPCEQFVLNSSKPKLVLEKFQNFFCENETESKRLDFAILSDREVEVLKAIALGLPNKLIADKLCISVHTVITHRKNLTNKLGIKSVSGLTVYALLNGMITAGEVE